MKFVNFANSIASQTAISCFECRTGGTCWGRGDGGASSVEPSYEAWYETSQLFCFKNWCLQDKTFVMLCKSLQLSKKVRLESESKEKPVTRGICNSHFIIELIMGKISENFSWDYSCLLKSFKCHSLLLVR